MPNTLKEHLIHFFQLSTPTNSADRKIRDEGIRKLKDPSINIENNPEDREKVAIMLSRYLGGLFFKSRLLSDHVKPILNEKALAALKAIDRKFYSSVKADHKRPSHRSR